MDEKKVSIIVPVYNSSKYLDRFMDSILAQTMPQGDYEVILVDDGSTDDSGDILDNYAKKYDHMRVIHQWNSGPAAARNAALKKATGEYVAFVDPDDLLEKKYLETAYVMADKNEADIFIFDAYREYAVDDDKASDEYVKREMNSHAEYSFTTDNPYHIYSMQRQILYPYMAARVADMTFNKNVPLAAPWDKLYRRQFLLDQGITYPDNLRVLDDMCFNFRAFGAAAKVSYCPTFLYRYKVVNTSITNSYRADRLAQDQKVFEYLEKEIHTMNLDKMQLGRFMQAYYARIIKSFAISMRLYFFNPQNPKTKKEIKEELRKYLDSAPYKHAIKNIHLHNLEPKLAAFTLACRLKAIWAIEGMYRLEYRK